MTSPAETLAPEVEVAPEVVGTRVVLVDDRPDRRAVMRQMFEYSGAAVAVVGEAGSLDDALALVATHDAALAVLDLPLPVQHGLDMVAGLRGGFPGLAIVVSSFNADLKVKDDALAAGADAYLVKPVSARELLAAMPAAPAAST